MMILYFVQQFAAPFFALGAAAPVIRTLTPFYRIIVLSVLLGFAALIGGIVLQLAASGAGNQWLFNFYIPAETAVLLYAGSLVFRSSGAKAVLCIAFALFFATWGWQVAQTGIGVFANKAAMLESVFLVALYLFILYRHTILHDGPVYRSPVFWICCGIILFFGCNIPYIGVIHFLEQKKPVLNNRLYNLIIVLQNVRYLFIGIAFIVYRKQFRNRPVTT